MLIKELEAKMIEFFSLSQKTLFDFMDGAIPDNITPIQYNILEYIYFGEGCILSSMSECLYMSLPNTSREVKKLVGKGFITRQDDPNDKRKHYLLLTDDGRKLMDAALEKLLANANKKYEHLSAEDQREVVDLMDRLIKKIF